MEEITATYTQLFQNYPDVVSTLQLCEMLGVSERTVYRLLVTNQIKHFKVGRAYRIPKVNVFAFMESECRIVIGNPLKLSPGFPPLHTGHATFTASGVPSSIVSAVIHNHSFTLAKFATLPPVVAVLR